MLYFVSSLYKSGVLWAKLPLCVNKFTQLVPLVISVLPTMSIRNHIIGGAAGGVSGQHIGLRIQRSGVRAPLGSLLSVL